MGWKNDPEKRKIGHRNYMRKRYNSDPIHREKHLVRVKTKYALKKPCVNCGNKKAEAHHPDYSKPDFRIWLCRDCHLLEHFYAGG